VTHFLSDIFTHPDWHGALAIAGKTTIIYFFLVLGLRLLGKRELGQMTIYDVVLIIVLANSVQNAMVGSDNSLLGGIIAAITLLVWNRLFTLVLASSKHASRLMVGEPSLIVRDGQLILSLMRKEGVTRNQVMAALREHGLTKLEDAEMCVLEVDGTISVVPRATTVYRSKRHFKALRI
jgi:uncharacterized membrane protein YcaP (DUF421 family)